MHQVDKTDYFKIVPTEGFGQFSQGSDKYLGQVTLQMHWGWSLTYWNATLYPKCYLVFKVPCSSTNIYNPIKILKVWLGRWMSAWPLAVQAWGPEFGSTHKSGVVVCTYDPELAVGRRDERNSQTCWPASLATVSPEFNIRDLASKRRWEVIEGDVRHQTLASGLHMDIQGLFLHTHMAHIDTSHASYVPHKQTFSRKSWHVCRYVYCKGVLFSLQLKSLYMRFTFH